MKVVLNGLQHLSLWKYYVSIKSTAEFQLQPASQPRTTSQINKRSQTKSSGITEKKGISACWPPKHPNYEKVTTPENNPENSTAANNEDEIVVDNPH